MTPDLWLTVAAVFGAVALLTGVGASRLLRDVTPERRRLMKTVTASATGVVLEQVSLTPEESKFVKQLTGLVPRSPKELGALRRRFQRAGIYTLGPVAGYTLAQVISPIVVGLLPLIWLPVRQGWPVAIVAALLGAQLPGFWLHRKIGARQRAVDNGLPDLLDLLIVCLEAGSSMDQAIIKSTDELEISYPALAQEFRLVVTETRAGKPRMEAFRNLSARTGTDDIRSLVAMLIQTDRFGTSVSQALRTHADVSRTKRRQRAEERAQKVGVKLVFPLVFMLFPAFFVVTLGPAVIQFVRVFYQQIGQ
ncbi:MAG TPA: type II secretion system F family protein [Vicinamibacterales bacterium]|nr:type II secretion system F family protein [Vicinamibacterales bacterium]